MVYAIDLGLCVGCGACAGNCPISAIEQVDGKYRIDSSSCVGCGVCESTCQINAISQK